MRRISFILGVIAMLFLAACDDYDSWTTSPDSKLLFSRDTLRFDTIITGQSSSTQSVIAFNQGDEGLRRISVRLRDGNQSPFRINVDGQYLNAGMGDDFEVRRRDSIVVRVEVKLPDEGDATVRHYEDKLIFTLESGVRQEVVLSADGMNVRIIRGKVVQSDETLDASMPYLIYDSLVVDKGATLTLEPGARLLFHDDVSLHVHGSLRAIGTQDNPIVLRGDRMDRMFDNLPYDNTPNRWGGVHFYGDSHDNIMEQCDIHSGNYGIICDSAFVASGFMPMLTLWNSVISVIGGDGLVIRNAKVQVVGCQISNCLANCVDILGGDVFMLHCTIAQYYSYVVMGQDALHLSNLDAEGNYVPISHAYFINCVITGYADDVIMGNLAPEDNEACDYLFDHCLLRTPRSDDAERFVEVIYDNPDLQPVNSTDHFVVFDPKNFIYDFTPWAHSSISSAGRADYTQEYCPEDRFGRPFAREDGSVPCGAYACKSE